MAIRRPLDTNVVDVTGADLASDIAISTTGNIATTGSGTLTVAGATNLASVATGTIASAVVFPADHVIQIKQTYDNLPRQFSVLNAANYGNYGFDTAGVNLTSLSVTITPTSTSSKILVEGSLFIGLHSSVYGVLRIYRSIGGVYPTKSDANQPWHASASGSTIGANAGVGVASITQNLASAHSILRTHFSYLDSPNTNSAIVYMPNVLAESDYDTNSSNHAYLNRTYYGTNDYGATCGASSITATEISG